MENSTFDLVKHHLILYTELRDNDNKLLIEVWKSLYPDLRMPEMTFNLFAINFSKHKYVNFETIRRYRQRLQEMYPNLRGEYYGNRHSKSKEYYKNLTQNK